MKPHLLYTSDSVEHEIFGTAMLECSFAGMPAPEILWRTPQGEILRLNENELSEKHHLELEQQHRSILMDTLSNERYQHAIEAQMLISENYTDKFRSGPGITLLENGILTITNVQRRDSMLKFFMFLGIFY